MQTLLLKMKVKMRIQGEVKVYKYTSKILITMFLKFTGELTEI